jgi:hypothetical protein
MIMAEETNINNCEYPATLKELIDDMEQGKYKHLQIILNRNSQYQTLGLGQEYLVVNGIGFAVYKLLNVDYINGEIILTLMNTENCKTGEIRLNIQNDRPEHFLINMQDLKEIIHAENGCYNMDDELLELEND